MKVILTSLIVVLPFAGMVSLGRMEDPSSIFLQEPKEVADTGCGAIPGRKVTDPPCPTGVCTTLSMTAQYRCNPAPAMFKCGGTYDFYKDKRDRWKWVCDPGPYYVSCGNWYNESCCTVNDPGPSCAGNSGILPCIGTP